MPVFNSPPKARQLMSFKMAIEMMASACAISARYRHAENFSDQYQLQLRFFPEAIRNDDRRIHGCVGKTVLKGGQQWDGASLRVPAYRYWRRSEMETRLRP